MASITCGNCHKTHASVREVAACHQFGAPRQQTSTWHDEPASVAQLSYITRLGGTAPHPGMTKSEASDLITRLKRPNARMQPAAAARVAPARPQLMTPMVMLEVVKDGRYAVRPDSNTPYTFLKVWRPKSGKKRDCLVISTQHSDAYREAVVRWPSGQVSVYDPRIDSKLLLLVADPMSAIMAYGREKEVCGRCGKKLTDGRSIWYGIGPECEGSWPEIINEVDEQHGYSYQEGNTHSECGMHG